MFSVQIFAEILVVGALLALAVSPIILRLVSTKSTSQSFWINASLKDTPLALAVVIILTYTIGIAGNRLIDDCFDLLSIDPGWSTKTDFANWAKATSSDVKSLKDAEFRLLKEEGPRLFLDRHKSFVRVLRAACFASAVSS
jgi:hypothetical protein